MNKKVLRLIFVLITISLIAALITQLFWVKVTWEHENDQFNNRVEVALKTVVNHLMTSDRTFSVDSAGSEYQFIQEHKDLFAVVQPEVLDSLITTEFSSIWKKKDFVYGVYRESDDMFVFGNYEGYEKELINSPHQISLTCICKSQGYLLSVYYPHQKGLVFSGMIILPIMSGLFLLVLIVSFFYTIYFIVRQKKLSEMKTDFVNNMTHEFKTPISTISVSSEMLIKSAVSKNPEKVKKYAKIIFDENVRLKNQVERVLQIASIDKGEYNLRMNPIDLHNIIESCVSNFEVVIAEKKGKIYTDLKADMHIITADRHHMTNVINNLLDNANKYSEEKPEIRISTENSEGRIEISIKDNGMGMSKESQKHIFKKFHRIQTGDIHDIKGFGLGLYYVYTVVEAMGGSVFVVSELNKGSEFKISFPV
jgi:two-component system phosphate regulon sensor histidine kinase PhoR